jgi:hypothetical protein
MSAEGEGFEPPLACASTVFKTVAIDHSAIPPCLAVGEIYCFNDSLRLLSFFLQRLRSITIVGAGVKKSLGFAQ